MVKAGLSDMVPKKKAAVELETYGPKVDALARKRGQERVEVEKEPFEEVPRDGAAREPGAVEDAVGAWCSQHGQAGHRRDADSRPTGSRFTTTGTLTDGTVFDSSRKRNVPATFPLNGVIKCWTEGVGRMKVGEKAVLTCPSASPTATAAARPPSRAARR